MAEDTSAPDVNSGSPPAPEPTPAERLAELRALKFGFDENPLDHFRGLTAEQIQAHGGIGAKITKKIIAQLAELDALAPPPPPAPAKPAPQVAVAGTPLEPAAPGGGGLQLLVVMLAVAAVIVVVLYGTVFRSKDGRELETARQTASQRLVSLDQISKGAADDALRLAKRVYEAAHQANFGEALNELDNVDAALTMAAAAAEHVETATQQRLAVAREAAAKTRVALKLEQAATKLELETTCKKLVDAVQAVKPTGESVQSDAGGQPEH